jgi:SAM-dependent methyltransferase
VIRAAGCGTQNMTTQYFSLNEAARRYAEYRPKVHIITLQWLNHHCGPRRWRRGLDVACGTGDSTEPLLQVCDEVLGIDSSAPMLEIAAERGLHVRLGSFTDARELGPFDLISTCMAFHWFELNSAISAYKRLSADGAIWIIYNFFFGRHASSTEFNEWFEKQYLKRYPSPPRNRATAVVPRDDPHLEFVGDGHGSILISLDYDQLVGYLSTQSNIEAAVRCGTSYSEVCGEISEQLRGIDLSGSFKYVYNYEIHRYTEQPTKRSTQSPNAPAVASGSGELNRSRK